MTAEERLKEQIKGIAEDCLIVLQDGNLPFEPLYEQQTSQNIPEEEGYQKAIWHWRLLLDECLRYLTVVSLKYESLIRGKHNTSLTKGQFSLLTRATLDCRGIITLLDQGLELQAATIMVSATEVLELAAAGMIDRELMEEFVQSQSPEEAKTFWHRNISRSKARKKIDKFMGLELGADALDDYVLWRNRGRQKYGAIKHVSFVPALLPLFGGFEHEPFLGLMLPYKSLQSIEIIQLFADGCSELALATMLSLLDGSSISGQQVEREDEGKYGFFDELWLDSYAAKGHEFIQKLWSYYILNQDNEPFSNGNSMRVS
ncbi:MAG: hypothetical protein AAF683_10985 [Pseudomonadota bacterium]